MQADTPSELAESTWLITGARGNIGRGLRVLLRSRVRHLVVADLASPEAPHPNETCLAVDLRRPATLRDAVAEADGVVHLAGIADEAPYRDLLEVNALGTYHLLEAMRAADVPRLVYASSNRITGLHPGTSYLDDQSTVRPDGLYGASKAAAEALTRLYSDKFGFQVANLRIGSFEERPTGPRQAATWLSHGDAWRGFEAAMTTTERFSTFYVVSRNDHRFWSLEPGERVGFSPQDNAADHLGPSVQPEVGGPQGGSFASAQYTLDHMEGDDLS